MYVENRQKRTNVQYIFNYSQDSIKMSCYNTTIEKYRKG